MTERSRRDVLRAGVTTTAALATASIPASADALPDGRSPVVAAGDGLVWGWNIPTDAVIKRHGLPSWIVHTSDDRTSALDEWATADDRYVIRHSEHVDAALIATTQDAAHGLAAEPWVESLDLDVEVELVDPVAAPGEGSLGLADLDGMEAYYATGAFGGRNVNTDRLKAGLAYRAEMPDATIDDTREYTNAVTTTVQDTAVILDTGVNAGSVFEDTLGSTRIRDASSDYTDPDRPTVGEDGLAVVDDAQGHGTWVASAIAGDGSNYTGYAPTADILVYKVLDDQGSGSSFNIAEAIRAASDEVGGDGVANLSLGSPVYSLELDKALAYAAGAGLPCVLAAGNSRHRDRWVASPADSPDAITVSATNAKPPGEAKSAAYHNHDPDSGARDLSGGETAGRHVDVTAPGCKIVVDTPAGESRLTGTSMAAPHVAGGLLQLLAEDSAVKGDVDAIRGRLQDYAAPVPAAGETEAGSGYLDVDAMVTETVPAESQEEARDNKARDRDLMHRRLSTLEGRPFLSRL